MNESVVTAPNVPIRASRREPAATRRCWVDRVQQFRDSNLSVAQFCLAEGVSVPPPSINRRRTLAAEGATDPPSSPYGALLRFSTDCDPDRIAALLRAVGSIPC